MCAGALASPSASPMAAPRSSSSTSTGGRHNLRLSSRLASVIDRLLKNQNPWENRNNLRSSSPHLVVPGNRTAILRSEIHGHGSHGCSDRRCSVRAFDGETAGGRRLARTPPRRVTRWLGGFDNRTAGSGALFSRG